LLGEDEMPAWLTKCISVLALALAHMISIAPSRTGRVATVSFQPQMMHVASASGRPGRGRAWNAWCRPSTYEGAGIVHECGVAFTRSGLSHPLLLCGAESAGSLPAFPAVARCDIRLDEHGDDHFVIGKRARKVGRANLLAREVARGGGSRALGQRDVIRASAWYRR